MLFQDTDFFELGRLSFQESWNHVLEARRVERLRLQRIRSDMMRNVYSGAVATKIF